MTAGGTAPLGPEFFHRPVELVARELLGAVVVSRAGGRVTAGRIVETEAYLGRDDPASHAWQGRRHAGNRSIYGPPGTWYVYRSYGVHWCANLVCAPEGTGAAVLLRALEPLDGADVMRERRGHAREAALCSGPGKLCAALGIARVHDGLANAAGEVTVFRGKTTAGGDVLVTPRIGITKAADWPLRFVVAGSPWASRSARGGVLARGAEDHA